MDFIVLVTIGCVLHGFIVLLIFGCVLYGFIVWLMLVMRCMCFIVLLVFGCVLYGFYRVVDDWLRLTCVLSVC